MKLSNLLGWSSALCLSAIIAQAQETKESVKPGQLATRTNAAPDSASSTNVIKLEPTTVVGRLDEAREQIVPSLGATVYAVTREQIASQAQGENAGFNQVLLRTPGMAQDGLGGLHLRGEHANLQYRINDVLLPEGITGFGTELDTRFVDTLDLITGSLPAQYGFRTAGVVDIHTRSGAFAPGGEVSLYGGSFDTFKGSFEYGGSRSNVNFFVNGSYTHSGVGIENPTASYSPIHDDTDQYRLFSYLSYLLDETSRISLIGSVSYSDYQLPNTPGLDAGNSPTSDNPTAIPWNQFMSTKTFDSTKLNERQNEQNYYGVVAYQKSVDNVNLQLSAFGRNSSTHFMPDPVGDLYYDGVASEVNRTIYSGGFEADLSYAVNEKHTLRGGVLTLDESASTHTTTTVFPVDSDGNPTGSAYPVVDNSVLHAMFYGLYVQDEWKISSRLTLNAGLRFDGIDSLVDENQASPRVNAVFKATEATTLHAGYARYFTPPALESVSSTSAAKFDGTSNASSVSQNDAVKAERGNYFDVGITHNLIPELKIGLDGYYKQAKNQLDDGLFGSSLIPTQFNYDEGKVYGAEFTVNFTKNGFSAFANVAYSVAQGKDVVSGQVLFSQDDLNYIKNNWVYLDHDQRVTGSFGVSYLWKHGSGSTRIFADALYGSGLRTDATASDGSTIPNGGSVPAYYSVNLGAEETIKLGAKQQLKARLDVVNITDNVYILRDGDGIGVNAAQYGARVGFYGTLSLAF
jgi:outer membrane receptor protein involved in Fe transport